MANVYTPADLEQAGVRKVEIKCRKCPRAGRYRVQTLIERYGRGCEDWLAQISADCPNRVETPNWYDRCGANCPTLVDVFLPPGYFDQQRQSRLTGRWSWCNSNNRSPSR